jgi:hypothetical protein
MAWTVFPNPNQDSCTIETVLAVWITSYGFVSSLAFAAFRRRGVRHRPRPHLRAPVPAVCRHQSGASMCSASCFDDRALRITNSPQWRAEYYLVYQDVAGPHGSSQYVHAPSTYMSATDRNPLIDVTREGEDSSICRRNKVFSVETLPHLMKHCLTSYRTKKNNAHGRGPKSGGVFDCIHLVAGLRDSFAVRDNPPFFLTVCHSEVLLANCQGVRVGVFFRSLQRSVTAIDGNV